MATTKLIIKNGKITESNNVYVHEIKPYYANANGWEVYINSKKSIIYCEKKRQYSDGEHVKKKIFPLEDGVLGLSGGYVDDSYAYFRSEKFQAFLSKYGITAVARLSKLDTDNDGDSILIDGREAHYGGGECHTKIYTDGEIELKKEDHGFTEEWKEQFPGTCAYECDTVWEIKNCTFIVREQRQDERDNHNYSKILYTNANVYDLEESLDKCVK